jgi:glutamate-1-semialdehyde 2,1-aminomutase
VVTGFRLAYGGAQEYYGVEPDLATYGKAIGGGYPIAAVCGRRDVLALSDPARRGSDSYAYLGGTLSGNPVAAVAGLATLREMRRPGVYERLFATGNRLRQGIETLGRDLGIPGTGPRRGTGLPGLLHGAPDTQPPGQRCRRCRAGLAVRPGAPGSRSLSHPGAKFYVSTVHGELEIERTLEVFAEALQAVKARGA